MRRGASSPKEDHDKEDSQRHPLAPHVGRTCHYWVWVGGGSLRELALFSHLSAIELRSEEVEFK